MYAHYVQLKMMHNNLSYGYSYCHRGVPRIWQGGGPRNFFFRFGKLRMAKPCALFGGMPPPEKFFLNGAIWCVLVYILIRFCLKKISCINTTNYSMLGSSGAYASSPEQILKMWCRLVCFEVYFNQIVY